MIFKYIELKPYYKSLQLSHNYMPTYYNYMPTYFGMI